MKAIRNLILVLGDQLDLESSLIKEVDASADRIWMAEVEKNQCMFGLISKRLFYSYLRCGIFVRHY